jgi:hypothetical protein
MIIRHIIYHYGIGDVDVPEKAIRDIPAVVEGILNKLPMASI